MSQEPEGNLEIDFYDPSKEISGDNWIEIQKAFENSKKRGLPLPPLRLARFIKTLSEDRFQGLNLNQTEFESYLTAKAGDADSIGLVADYVSAFPESRDSLVTEELWETSQRLLKEGIEKSRAGGTTFLTTDLVIDIKVLFPDRDLGLKEVGFYELKMLYTETLELAEKLDKDETNGMTVQLPTQVLVIKSLFPDRFPEINFDQEAKRLTKKQADIAKSKGYWAFFLKHAANLTTLSNN